MITQSHFDAFVNQERPTLAALPAPAGFVLAPIAPTCQPNRYARPDFVNQVRPTLAALPAPAGFELCFVAPAAQPQKFAKSDFVNQVRPTLAVLPAPAGFELAYVARQAQPLDYAPSTLVEPDKVLPSAASSFVAGWMSTDGKVALVLPYADSAFVTSAAPLIPIAAGGRADYSQVRLGGMPLVPRAYDSMAGPENTPAVAASVFGQWLLTEGIPCVQLVFARGAWCAPDKLFATVPITAPWVNAVGAPAIKVAFAQGSVNAPDKMATAAPATPTLAQWLTTDGQGGLLLRYSNSVFTAPDKMVAAFQVLGRVDYSQVRLGGTPPVPGHYDAVVQPSNAAATTPLPVGVSFTSTDGKPAVELMYATSAIVAPDKSTQVVLAVGVSFTATDGKPAVELAYAQPSVVAPDKPPVVVPATPTLAQWLTTDGLIAALFRFVAGSFAAPDKMVAAPQMFGRVDYSQVRLGGMPPVPGHYDATTQPTSTAQATTVPLGVSFETTDGAKAVVLVYAPSSVNAPDKANLVTAATTFLPGWLSTDGKVAQPLDFAPTTVVTADKATVVVPPTPTLAQWLTTDGLKAVQYVFANGSWVAPDKMTGVAVVVPLFAWKSEDPYVPKFDFYMMGDTLSGPATMATALQSFAATNLPPRALPPRYDSAAATWSGPLLPVVTSPLPLMAIGLAEQPRTANPPTFTLPGPYTAPDKANLVVAAPTFLPGWMTTDGWLAVVLDYIKGDTYVAPDKANQVVAAQTFLPGWMATLGSPAMLLKYLRGDYAAPDKFAQVAPAQTFLPQWLTTDGSLAVVLQYLRGDVFTAPDKANQVVAAPTFLPGWMATIGAAAVTLRYAPSDVVNQVRATLATLATLLSGIADPGINAQPQKFAASGTTAPEKSIPTPPSVIGWTATPGLPAVQLRYAQAETFVAQVVPTLATLPVLLSGIADPGIQKLVLTYWQSDPWIGTPLNLPFTGGNPVGLLAGKTIPLIGVLTGKVVQAIGITAAKILQAVGIKSGKVIS